MADETSGRRRLREVARRAMREHGLEPELPHDALAEADALQPLGQATAGARDLRDRPWVSIDNDDTRDIDQLSLAEPAGLHAVRLLVAVADVEVAVARDGAVDRHAATNTTSVYTAAEIFPMLPERLSTDLTSLVAGEDRLATVVDMAVATDGTVEDFEIYQARVRNAAKLAYDSVAAWLDGEAPLPPAAGAPPVSGQLVLQDRVGQAMRAQRHLRGALTLEHVEAHPVFEGDTLVALRPDRKNRSKEMVEDFMIAANIATARFLERSGVASLRRVLRSPARWERIVELAAAAGETLPAEPSAPALQRFLTRRRAAEPRRFPELSLAVVKLLGSGEYAVELPGEAGDGHFGLAVKDYAQSTAPNRRFPDLVTQRLVKAVLRRQAAPYSTEELVALARHCTLQEDNAGKVERQVYKSAASLLLDGQKGRRFAAIVTGASSKGTWVRLLEPRVEGRLVRGERGLDVGEPVEVELLHTDVERGFIDFVRA